GVSADYGPMHFQFAPVAFLSQNAPFSLADNAGGPTRQYADARFQNLIDAPQRFGSKTYGRIDLGNTTLALQTNPITFGVSTAAQSWGPAREFPLVLSSHSGGFPHLFIGTGTPFNLGILSVHARLLTGTLSQSAFSPIDTGNAHRWMSAGIITLIPRGAKGLEFGLIRFVQGISTHDIPTLAQASRAVQGAAIGNGDNVESENQIASVFFRWAFAGAGLELYGEYAREDYSLDGRRFIQYPDDLRSYLFGFQRVLKSDTKQLGVLRFELVNAELSASNRGERGDIDTKVLFTPNPPYLHAVTRQGHTNNGLFLGSAEAFGGAGWRLGFDQFRTSGRRSITLERSLRLDWLPSLASASKDARPDVLWSAGAEAVRFRGHREFGLSVLTTYELNRNLVQKNDAFNLRMVLSTRGW
ncbi:MAG: capsule assembly Wzi family protein, partial [Gemmatimonadaceae bacterium]